MTHRRLTPLEVAMMQYRAANDVLQDWQKAHDRYVRRMTRLYVLLAGLLAMTCVGIVAWDIGFYLGSHITIPVDYE